MFHWDFPYLSHDQSNYYLNVRFYGCDDVHPSGLSRIISIVCCHVLVIIYCYFAVD